MSLTEVVLFIITPIVALFIIAVIVLKLKKQPKSIEFNIYELIDKENIISIDLLRKKLVITVKEIDLVDPNNLKEHGATAISIVGNKIKFLIKDEETTLNIYQDLT